MTSAQEPDRYVQLVEELLRQPAETEWLEFKENMDDPQEIGKYISALANSAALRERIDPAYLVWGIRDSDHEPVGTIFNPETAKGKGNETLERWLLENLNPHVKLNFQPVSMGDKQVVVLEITPTGTHPISFSGERYIRVGSSTEKLGSYPEKEKQLWEVLGRTLFETDTAAENLPGNEVVRLLDYTTYFDLLEARKPENDSGVLEALELEGLIAKNPSGNWDIKNLGASLLAKNLKDFESLWGKTVRIAKYEGSGRTGALEQQEFFRGYASGFKELTTYLEGIIPSPETINGFRREKHPAFPELAVRELVANMLIHQNFTSQGDGPLIELFDNRIEIANPGEPLIEADRFLDRQPATRNEKLADLMRRFGLSEKMGTGFEKVVIEVELNQLPAPLVEVPPGSTRVTLFAHKSPNVMTGMERIRACYFHASLKYIKKGYMTNSSLRERFGLQKRDTQLASKYIRDAMEAGVIKVAPNGEAKKNRKYMPFWA